MKGEALKGGMKSLLLLAAMAWTRLPDIPDPRGFAGAFAGVQDGKLIVAGGTHFTDKMPWEGGTKVWYDTVHAFDGEWKVIGKLPKPNGYGVSITTGQGMLIAGWPETSNGQVFASISKPRWHHSASGAFCGGIGVAFIGSVGSSSRS